MNIPRVIVEHKTRFIIIAIGVFFACMWIALRQKPGSDTSFYTVIRGPIAESIVISGNANSLGNASVYSPSTGIVTQLFVKNGDMVKKGQELAKIQSTAMETDRANAWSAYQSAVSAANTSKQSKIVNQSALETGRKSVIDASVALQQMKNRRNEGLSNPATGKPYTQDEIDSITSSYTSSKTSFDSLEKKYLDSDSTIASAQSAVSATWLAYQATQNGVIKAPIDGKVINLSVGSGEYVSAKISGSQATVSVEPIMRLQTDASHQVRVKLNEIDVLKVEPGLPAKVSFDALSGIVFDGIVDRVDAAGVNENAVVTYATYILIASQDDRIRPAMTATVTIATREKEDVLLVPNAAIQKKDTQSIVKKKIGSSTKDMPIQVGIKNAEFSEILEGVSEGDVIVAPKGK